MELVRSVPKITFGPRSSGLLVPVHGKSASALAGPVVVDVASAPANAVVSWIGSSKVAIAAVGASGGPISTVPASGGSLTNLGATAPDNTIAANATKVAFRSGAAGVDSIRVIGSDGTGETVLVGAASGIFGPVISPDGTTLAYFDGSHAYTVPVAGGSPTTLASSLSSPQPGSWGGSSIAYLSAGNLYLVPASGGAPVLFGPATSGAILSPDGTKIVYSGGSGWVLASVAGGSASAAAYATSSGVPAGSRTVVAGGWSPDSSKFVFASAGGAWVVNASDGTAVQIYTQSARSAVWSADGTKVALYNASTHKLVILTVA